MQVKNDEDARKQAQEVKQAAEEAAKRDFHRYFYTLENDRVAMLEQQRLDELDRQVEAEMSGQQGGDAANGVAPGAQQGSLSSANLGASSLIMKHLLTRIDQQRSKVKANDNQLRRLISEVRKNRSKWASEEKVGQEELYEAAERVLQELKAMTEHSGPFLNRVSKREAPDYYNFIKYPMDIGTMMKKLKNFQYKSKKEFVGDLHLIWTNCLKYNTDPQHFLRKKALIMQKHTDRLVVLIPDIVVRDRAEVEAEERRNASLDADLDGIEDSDEEVPIMASRGRKAPSKGKKGNTANRKAPPTIQEGTPGLESKPLLASLGSSSNFRNSSLRAESDAPMEGNSNGFVTPPPGTITPNGPNGVNGTANHADPSDADGASNPGQDVTSEDPAVEDLDYRTWKQVTKKARATAAAERNQLFRGNRINPDAPALLRSRAGMRRWMRQQKILNEEDPSADPSSAETSKETLPATGESLAEGIEEEDDTLLPDYYDPVSAIPDIDDRLKWENDSEGNIILRAEECFHIVPKEQFVARESILTRKMDANMRQMQDTRKIVAKIGIVKQMQLQSQMYQNQFPKYQPLPLAEADVEPMVVTDDGPFMAPVLCRSALQRTVCKIFYHAGFEECQPAALEAITDLAGHYFKNLAQSLKVYTEAPKVRQAGVSTTSGEPVFQRRFSFEESVLHTLNQNGHDVEALESYVKEDVERVGSKLSVMHERMKSHLAELLRPALDPAAGSDGVGAFNDNSEQFIGGDFAEDIGEDFFGFKELGLDKEFGLASLSVPLHLLQNRVYGAHQAQNTSSAAIPGIIMDQPAPFEPVTVENISREIGIVQDFFRARLAANGDQPLVEDDDLPAKQRFPRPRLPPTGKISSPRKRPLREQQQMAKKKRKMEEGKEEAGSGNSKPFAKPAGKLRLEMPPPREPVAEPEKGEDTVEQLMSPESM
ncbi:hypothetical protein EJ06DRAFT_477975 [Trichodelitschia bisporula]|uniref:SAGA complex subunit Spt7 n=1 Tax=Trichodelitschia bisporula TaxID=703511 RepID=A0A6G1HVB4_9PEZI|nr:hypothetical protein EJ06DRAFT_477975 [Trichodelitschia bisporula]